ncbi:hypothetical protein EL22_01605 [Halostagnicola sp. A56]|uniref:hypothetical protein n=1 Tax=Halostagnicola sp. A56 TaxID=1495067 RepID=UPI0004A15F35|nr:hypothetical protein [Halostagnicola sp. A56]KDE58887.1 hypothetical protein EL22_01605 [Halostagnicola sp. A56]
MIAILASVLGITSIGIAVFMATTLPEKSAVGEFAAGASVLITILYALLGMFVLMEVGLLALLIRRFNSSGWPRRLVTGGVIFGATGTGILILEWILVKFRLTTILYSSIPTEVDYLFVLGLLLVPFSIACSVSGVLLYGLSSIWVEIRS